jgi:hypothetical protein
MKGAGTTDDKYSELKAKLTLLKDSDDDVKKIKKYIDATSGGRGMTLLDVWSCEREGDRYKVLSLSLSLSLTHTHTLPPRSRSLSLALSLSLSLSHTHTQTRYT